MTTLILATRTFAGVRRVDGQSLALLKRGEEIVVMPIDDRAIVRKMNRLSIGDPVSITENGAIKTMKGRSR